MNHTASDSQLDPLDQLAEEYLARLRRGEHPTVAEYAEKHPELAERIREFFPALHVVEDLASVGGQATGPFPKSSSDDAPPRQLGEYRILRTVGRGGMGVVYEAVQESLGRHVALKVFPFHSALSTTHLERFRREARAAAKLHHSNIVPVFGVGEDGGVHYYAMQFIRGQSLDAVLQELKHPPGNGAGPGLTSDGAGREVTVALTRSLMSGRFANQPDEPGECSLAAPPESPAKTETCDATKKSETSQSELTGSSTV